MWCWCWHQVNCMSSIVTYWQIKSTSTATVTLEENLGLKQHLGLSVQLFMGCNFWMKKTFGCWQLYESRSNQKCSTKWHFSHLTSNILRLVDEYLLESDIVMVATVVSRSRIHLGHYSATFQIEKLVHVSSSLVLNVTLGLMLLVHLFKP